MARRVVITGIGAVSGLGLGAGPFWDGLVGGRSALGRIRRYDPAGFDCRLGAEVPEFAIKDFVPKHYRKATKVMARDTELAVIAAKLGVEDAGIVTRGTLEEGETGATTYPPERMGCHIGAGLIAAEVEEISAAQATAVIGEGAERRFSLRAWGGEGGGGMEQLTPLWLLKYLPNMLACHVTIIHGTEGPSNTITCAEASGLLSIGESARVIERGAADLCFSGGAESKINPMGQLRLELAGWLAKTGDSAEPDRFVRPYAGGGEGAGSGDGGLPGEGGGILILEEKGSADRRGARVYAEIVGVGGGHSDPDYSAGEDDEGFGYAIENALDDAGVGPEKISAIVPLGAGVAKVDRAELGALRRIFGRRLAEVPLVTLTPNIGNAMAGIGALQAAAAALCLRHQRVPARLRSGGGVAGTDAGPSGSRGAELGHVLACAGSLGGQNAALVLRAPGF